MFEISFFAAEAAFTAIWLLVRISIWIRQKSIDWKREAVLALMYINLAVIIRFVLFPRDLVDGHIQPLVFDTATAFPLRINLVPLVHLFDYDNVRDIVWCKGTWYLYTYNRMRAVVPLIVQHFHVLR